MSCSCSRKRWELEQEKAGEEEFRVSARDDVGFVIVIVIVIVTSLIKRDDVSIYYCYCYGFGQG